MSYETHSRFLLWSDLNRNKRMLALPAFVEPTSGLTLTKMCASPPCCGINLTPTHKTRERTLTTSFSHGPFHHSSLTNEVHSSPLLLFGNRPLQRKPALSGMTPVNVELSLATGMLYTESLYFVYECISINSPPLILRVTHLFSHDPEMLSETLSLGLL